jgi:thioesterase domain-containing protein
MAQQLQRAGHDVSLLAILDTPAPGSYRSVLSGDSVAVFLTTIMRGLGPYLWDYEYLVAQARMGSSQQGMNGATSHASSPLRFLHLIRRRIERAAISAIVPSESHLLLYHPPAIRQMLDAFGRGLIATLRYRPRVFSGSVTLLRTGDQTIGGEQTALLGWDKLACSVKLSMVPGNHMTLLRRPYVTELARPLQMLLDESRQYDVMPHPASIMR